MLDADLGFGDAVGCEGFTFHNEGDIVCDCPIINLIDGCFAHTERFAFAVGRAVFDVDELEAVAYALKDSDRVVHTNECPICVNFKSNLGAVKELFVGN